ncbi:hypothetical protein GCM10011341_20610 [Frigidibacter albus]|nr:hypothetical protein GCM10011341_20610 [Frigidibacter albus]
MLSPSWSCPSPASVRLFFRRLQLPPLMGAGDREACAGASETLVAAPLADKHLRRAGAAVRAVLREM